VLDENGKVLKVPLMSISVEMAVNAINTARLELAFAEIDVGAIAEFYHDGRRVSSITYEDGSKTIFAEAGVIEDGPGDEGPLVPIRAVEQTIDPYRWIEVGDPRARPGHGSRVDDWEGTVAEAQKAGRLGETNLPPHARVRVRHGEAFQMQEVGKPMYAMGDLAEKVLADQRREFDLHNRRLIERAIRGGAIERDD
jgi:hypothetical protein